MYKEFAKTYKMNTLLRVPRVFSNVVNKATGQTVATQAKLSMIRKASEFVYIGDGLSLDLVGEIASQDRRAANSRWN